MLARCAAPMMHYFHLSPSYSACNITLHIYSLWCFRASLNALSKNCSLGPLWIHCLKTVLVLTWFLFLGNIIFFLNKPFIYKKISHLQDWLISWKKKILVIFFKRNCHILAKEWNSIISFCQTINIPSSIIKLSKKWKWRKCYYNFLFHISSMLRHPSNIFQL